MESEKYEEVIENRSFVNPRGLKTRRLVHSTAIMDEANEEDFRDPRELRTKDKQGELWSNIRNTITQLEDVILNTDHQWIPESLNKGTEINGETCLLHTSQSIVSLFTKPMVFHRCVGVLPVFGFILAQLLYNTEEDVLKYTEPYRLVSFIRGEMMLDIDIEGESTVVEDPTIGGGAVKEEIRVTQFRLEDYLKYVSFEIDIGFNRYNRIKNIIKYCIHDEETDTYMVLTYTPIEKIARILEPSKWAEIDRAKGVKEKVTGFLNGLKGEKYDIVFHQIAIIKCYPDNQEKCELTILQHTNMGTYVEKTFQGGYDANLSDQVLRLAKLCNEVDHDHINLPFERLFSGGRF